MTYLRYSLKQYNDNLKKFSSFIDDYSLSYFNKINASNTSNSNRNYLSADDLISILNKCSLNATHLDSKIFKNLIELLNNTFSMNGTHVISNNETSKTNSAYDNLDRLIKSYVNSTSSLIEIDYYDNCLQTVLFGYFSLFSEQFSTIYENNSPLRQILADRNAIVNKTLVSLLQASGHFNVSQNEKQFLKIPLRNIEDIVKRYQKTKASYFNSSLKLCDAQPPILCN